MNVWWLFSHYDPLLFPPPIILFPGNMIIVDVEQALVTELFELETKTAELFDVTRDATSLSYIVR